MYKTKLNKIWNLIGEIKNDINLEIISEFLEWFYEKINIHFNKKSPDLKLNKWDVYFVNLWKNIWDELNKNRPCIIYSGYFFNNWNSVTVIPLKSYRWKINKNFNIFIKNDFLDNPSIIDVWWIRQVSKKRIWLFLWTIGNDFLQKVDKKILKLFTIKNR